MYVNQKHNISKNWSNLAIGLCPVCDYKLREKERLHANFPNLKSIGYECENPDCPFFISKIRRDEIVENLAQGKLREGYTNKTRDELPVLGEDDNFNGLQSL